MILSVILSVLSVTLGLAPFYCMYKVKCGTHDELIQKEGLYKKFTEIREQAEGWRITAK